MSSELTVGSYADEAELKRFGEILSETFAAPPERAMPYIDSGGRENVRLVRLGKQVVGGLLALPKGQWFGERSVPMNGIAAVAVAPDQRARGAATVLLKALLEELHQRGTPISSLYPATRRLYRRVGYEMAGLEPEVELPVKSIDLRDRTLEMRPATDSDQAGIRAAYAAWARHNPGNLDRSEFNWSRVRKFRDQEAQGYVACRDGQIEGYIYVRSQQREPEPPLLYAHDVVALTPAAARRLLTFLADHRTVRSHVRWRTGLSDPLLATLAEGEFKWTHWGGWMLRIVDVVKALEARGYPPEVRAELHFRVHDDVLRANDGNFVLEVGDGVGHARAGGRGTIDIQIRGLAALYTGFLAPHDIIMASLAAGPAEELAKAGPVFAGPMPWMRDAF